MMRIIVEEVASFQRRCYARWDSKNTSSIKLWIAVLVAATAAVSVGGGGGDGGGGGGYLFEDLRKDEYESLLVLRVDNVDGIELRDLRKTISENDLAFSLEKEILHVVKVMSRL